MNPTDIDELLHQHGRQWIESQPPPPSLESAVRDAKGVSRSRIRYLAVAACVIGVLGIVAVPLARTLADRQAPLRPAGPSSRTVDKLSQSARASGLANGDSHVTAEAVLTTYLAAERAVHGGDTSSDPAATTPVWVVQVHGNFVCNNCPRPPGAAAPSGHVITLIVIAATLQHSDFSLSNNSHDLAGLGSVITLKP